MRYQGSKRRLINEIKPIIEKNFDSEEQLYIEPFGGGMNSFSYISHKNKIALDVNQYVIEMWNGIKNNTLEIPTSVSESLYKEMKNDCLNNTGKFSKGLLGYVGNACSNGCGWWNGYAHFNPKKNEDHIKEARNGLMKQINKFQYLKNSSFICMDYRNFDYPSTPCVIYCDPPYASTKGYNKNGFNNEEFWEWCRKMVKLGHKVMISEYSAPEDFVCIWKKSVKDGMATTKSGESQKDKVEKLFIHKSQMDYIKY